MALIQKEIKCTTRNFSLPEPLDRLLVQRAQIEDRPVSRVIRRALEKYLVATEEGVKAEEVLQC